MKLYNSLSRKTENFVPLDPSMVKIYSCGVTTYDEIHLGHVRQAVVFDVLRNYFEYLGYKVIYVRNFTDIDDKIIKKANDKHQDPLELSDYYVQETVKDLRKLKVGDATFQPKVTETIPEIIDFIGALIDKGNAYVANGEVLFDVDSFAQYGKLSGRKTEDLVSGDESANKRKPYDFSLWKPAKEGEPFWDSPWGSGRPGWHIECSVMAKKYLGDTFDIHGGGLDLVFPHHENEIAQSEAANGKVLANYWMHNGLVNLNGKKMSKSLGNFYTVKDLLKKYTVDEIRLAVLSRGFSLPLNFSEKLFVTTRKKLYNFYKILSKIDSILSGTIPDFSVNWAKYEKIDKLESNFKTAMDDNFNTAKAITSIALAFDQA
ncbi:cysteine--tRNA ligase, partial [Patescibacteria group bacterium]|nr:cysteine--tRNA ligase [Patescibacteria group bacterium]